MESLHCICVQYVECAFLKIFLIKLLWELSCCSCFSMFACGWWFFEWDKNVCYKFDYCRPSKQMSRTKQALSGGEKKRRRGISVAIYKLSLKRRPSVRPSQKVEIYSRLSPSPVGDCNPTCCPSENERGDWEIQDEGRKRWRQQKQSRVNDALTFPPPSLPYFTLAILSLSSNGPCGRHNRLGVGFGLGRSEAYNLDNWANDVDDAMLYTIGGANLRIRTRLMPMPLLPLAIIASLGEIRKKTSPTNGKVQ